MKTNLIISVWYQWPVCRELFIHLIDLHQHPVGGEDILAELHLPVGKGAALTLQDHIGVLPKLVVAGFIPERFIIPHLLLQDPFSQRLLLFSPEPITRNITGLQEIGGYGILLITPVRSHAIREIGFPHIFVKMFQDISGRIFFTCVSQAQMQPGNAPSGCYSGADGFLHHNIRRVCPHRRRQNYS